MIVGRYVGSASKGNQEFASSAQKHRCRTCSEGKKGIERAFPDKARDRQGKSSGRTIPHRKAGHASRSSKGQPHLSTLRHGTGAVIQRAKRQEKRSGAERSLTVIDGRRRTVEHRSRTSDANRSEEYVRISGMQEDRPGSENRVRRRYRCTI